MFRATLLYLAEYILILQENLLKHFILLNMRVLSSPT